MVYLGAIANLLTLICLSPQFRALFQNYWNSVISKDVQISIEDIEMSWILIEKPSSINYKKSRFYSGAIFKIYWH